MIERTVENIKNVSSGLSNYSYAEDLKNNGTATKELMDLFDSLDGTWVGRKLNKAEDYVSMYDDNFYTYKTWEELVRSENEQGAYGMTRTECAEQIGVTIWRLPCGWYVQYV